MSQKSTQLTLYLFLVSALERCMVGFSTFITATMCQSLSTVWLTCISLWSMCSLSLILLITILVMSSVFPGRPSIHTSLKVIYQSDGVTGLFDAIQQSAYPSMRQMNSVLIIVSEDWNSISIAEIFIHFDDFSSIFQTQ